MKMGNIKILLAILKKTHSFKDGKMTKNCFYYGLNLLFSYTTNTQSKDGNMTIKVCKAHKVDQVKE